MLHIRKNNSTVWLSFDLLKKYGCAALGLGSRGTDTGQKAVTVFAYHRDNYLPSSVDAKNKSECIQEVEPIRTVATIFSMTLAHNRKQK